MGRDFYTFAGENLPGDSDKSSEQDIFGLSEDGCVPYPARIAVYDDPSMTPRVVIIDPCDIHAFLEEITLTVNKLSREQGGSIPFIIIREVVENFIHALFIEPTISILDNGNTIRFSDQGPGIKEKNLALEYGTSSANPQMKRYIRGVGSGLPNAMQYMLNVGGSLTIQDNISGGTVVTISTKETPTANKPLRPEPRPEPASVKTFTQQASVQNSFDSMFEDMKVSTRGKKILVYLSEHEGVGPTDLVREFEGSSPTWSRELSTLDKKGLLQKEGQKRYLTEIGEKYLDFLTK